MAMPISPLNTIPPKSGTSFTLKMGDHLRVVDTEGGQVSDLCCVAFPSGKDALSSGCTIDYNETISLTIGHILYSGRGLPMMKIVEDSVGCHDILLAPCSSEMFRKFHKNSIHPSCKSNLCNHLSHYNIAEDIILSTFNIFMNVCMTPQGRVEIHPPRSKPGDFIQLRAMCDLIVGLTACSDEQTNNGTLKPILYQITRTERVIAQS